MTYIPHSPKERDEMLATIGVKKLEDLFNAIQSHIEESDKEFDGAKDAHISNG